MANADNGRNTRLADAEQVTEIGMSRGLCYGPCPVYAVTLRPTGEALFEGKHFVNMMGSYVARIEPSTFATLALAAVRVRFPSLKRRYDAQVTCVPITTTWAVYGGVRHTVEDYGRAGPRPLREFEELIDAAADELTWRRLGQAAGAPTRPLFVGPNVDDARRPSGDEESPHWTQRGGHERK